MNNTITIIIGIILGMLYFSLFEKRNIDKEFHMECWEKLHYLNKQRSSLAFVHAKSILAGISLIILAIKGCGNMYNKAIIFLGSGIVGLHIGQCYNEFSYINNKQN